MTAPEVPSRPTYLTGEARIDDLARMVLELTSEVWILKDRNLVLENLLATKGVLAEGEIDDVRPAAELAAVLRREREALVARVMGALLPSDDRVAAALQR
ncbi:hypothetical protein [Kineosporia sp. NBRC 101731]|uniref:hypothetical protein n=1 Tax=Kineosporia sp. NBRC 101731 TaxID=3032199 RepID=UPI0024A57A29|nr:hypothetical protein [Kineosporia sp. NBRC 101731]GLY29643.1 hypothetical protein Kisp02_30080 [Kineosporia sp. NBRC 101731]